jgi:hypothetical protein
MPVSFVLLGFGLLTSAVAQEQLWFGTVEDRGTTVQARYEVNMKGKTFVRITYAPYGLTPAWKHAGLIPAPQPPESAVSASVDTQSARPPGSQTVCG